MNQINLDNKDYTTPEQSKVLLELGVPTRSANMYYYDMGNGFIYAPEMIETKRDLDELNNDPRYLPAWTTGRLMYIINTCVPNNRGQRMLVYMNMRLYMITDFVEMLRLAIETLVEKDMINFDNLKHKL